MEKYNLENIFKRYDGILKTKELYRNGVSKYDIKKLTDTHVLERITQGYYKLVDEEISDIKLISILLPEGVLCFDSALVYYGYSDRIPMEWHIAVNKYISKSKVKLDYPYLLHIQWFFLNSFFTQMKNFLKSMMNRIGRNIIVSLIKKMVFG